MTVKGFERLPDPRPVPRSVHVPSLILRGGCDFVRPEVALEYRQTLPGSRLVHVPGAGARHRSRAAAPVQRAPQGLPAGQAPPGAEVLIREPA
jgi:pimeloyl-ACP methyl ester carboxylesterase